MKAHNQMLVAQAINALSAHPHLAQAVRDLASGNDALREKVAALQEQLEHAHQQAAGNDV